MSRKQGNQLTTREQDIICLLAEGLSNREIAAILEISIRSIEEQCSRIMIKLQIHNIAELLKFAIREGLTNIEKYRIINSEPAEMNPQHSSRKVMVRGDKSTIVLSEREREILKLLSDGYSNRELSHWLMIPVSTIDDICDELMRKLGIKNTTDLVKYAIKEDKINIEQPNNV
jgi:DNA-binding NarL/FixJ family response regulator